MNDIAKKTLASIKERQIKPVPKWCFVGKRYLCWGGTALAVIAGALVGALLLIFLREYDWDVIDFRHHEGWHTLFIIIPYFWIIFFLLLAALAMILLRRTDRGYRFESLHLIALTAAMVIAGGALLAALNVHQKTHDFFVRHSAYYERTRSSRQDEWSHPEHGLLGGEIHDQRGNVIMIRDFRGWCCWEVITDENTLWPGNHDRILPGRGKIRVMGVAVGEHGFKAREIRPWETSWLVQDGNLPQIP